MILGSDSSPTSSSPAKKKSSNSRPTSSPAKQKKAYSLPEDKRKLIDADEENKKLWEELVLAADNYTVSKRGLSLLLITPSNYSA